MGACFAALPGWCWRLIIKLPGRLAQAVLLSSKRPVLIPVVIATVTAVVDHVRRINVAVIVGRIDSNAAVAVRVAATVVAAVAVATVRVAAIVAAISVRVTYPSDLIESAVYHAAKALGLSRRRDPQRCESQESSR